MDKITKYTTKFNIQIPNPFKLSISSNNIGCFTYEILTKNDEISTNSEVAIADP